MVLIALVACSSAPEPEAEPDATLALEEAVIDVDSPETCRICHAEVYDEWAQSMHAHAHHDKDPVHAGMRRMRMEKQGDAVAEQCASCHTPRAPDDVESAIAKTGVSCSGCHLVQEIHRDRGPGAKAFVYGQVMRGPYDLDNGTSPAHPVGEAPTFVTDGETLCLACHDATKNPAGVPACTTGPEHRAVEGSQTCVSCHMPRVEGPAGAVTPHRPSHASHRFHGPHDAWNGDPSFLAGGLGLRATLEGTRLTVTLENKVDHGFPTGFPGRMVVVAARGLDAGGEEVWTSGPPTPETVLNKVYVDAEGQPVPPPFAVKLEADRRLGARETRAFTFEVPPAVVTAEARVVMRLLPPPMAQRIGLADAPEGQPRTLTSVRVAR